MAYVSHNLIRATETEQEFVLIQEFSWAILFNEC